MDDKASSRDGSAGEGASKAAAPGGAVKPAPHGNDADEYKQNFDALVKDGFAFLREDVMDFLKLPGTMIAGATNVEVAKVDIIHFAGDLTFSLVSSREVVSGGERRMENLFGLDLEMEADVSSDDLLRFCMYNAAFRFAHKCNFTTYVLTTRRSAHSAYDTPDLKFSPNIIRLYENDCDELYREFAEKLDGDGRINRLSLICYPFSGGSKTRFKKALEALRILAEIEEDGERLKHLADLIYLGVAKDIGADEKKELRRLTRMIIDRTSVLEYADEELVKERDAANAALREKDAALAKERDATDAALREMEIANAALREKDAALAKERDAADAALREMEIANAALKERETDLSIIRLAWDKEEPEAIARRLGVSVERVESVLGGLNK
jgi:hypothetical protein